ncbi:MAG: DUF72 domain-containing protein [Nitrospinota bacterium]
MAGKLFLGTSSWTAEGWEKSFYPPGTRPSDYLTAYARVFHTVECDATFYRIPSAQAVDGWRRKLPGGFVFAAKIPQVITHEKVLEDCEEDLKEFLGVMDLLGDNLGPLLFQFPYFNKKRFSSPKPFFARLQTFLKKLPPGHRFAVEVRNKAWVGRELLGILRDHGVAFTLIDHPWMHRIDELMERVDPVTADFVFVRWLGDRRKIEEMTDAWDTPVIDRTESLLRWVPVFQDLLERKLDVLAYFNNHYAGHAPASVRMLQEMLVKVGVEV